MKYCPNCKTPQSANSQFCPTCGTPVVESQPQPQQWSPAQQPQTWTQPTQQKQRTNVLIVTIIAVAAIVICAMLIFAYITTQNKSADEAPAMTETTTNATTGGAVNHSNSSTAAGSVSHIAAGLNTFNGVFYYNGADYQFDIQFYFDPDTHNGSNALYTATGNGATNKISSIVFSDNDYHVRIKGPSLRIQASRSADGTYKGTMTRGTHSGSIVMYL